MSEHPLPRDLMEKLARVDSKLEELLAYQTLLQDESRAETQPVPDENIFENFSVADAQGEKIHTAAGSSSCPINPLPLRVAVSPQETDSIFQKVDKINKEVEVMWRVEKLERQNRKIIILGSIFITLVILMIGVSTFLMFQANVLNQRFFLKTSQQIDPSQPSSGEAAAKVTFPQPPPSIAEVHGPEPVEPIARVNDPQPVVTPMVPKLAETTSPDKYVGS